MHSNPCMAHARTLKPSCLQQRGSPPQRWHHLLEGHHLHACSDPMVCLHAGALHCAAETESCRFLARLGGHHSAGRSGGPFISPGHPCGHPHSHRLRHSTARGVHDEGGLGGQEGAHTVRPGKQCSDVLQTCNLCRLMYFDK